MIGATAIMLLLAINARVRSFSDQRLFRTAEEVPVEGPPRVAIVFGAGAKNNQPTPALYDRVYTAAELYKLGRVKKLLMSGDNPSEYYDEPTVMKKTAMQMGVPESDIVLDFAGRRTFDTCYRAREIFDVKNAVLVTQEFHQPRALYLCRDLGIESVGVIANRQEYLGENWWAVREFLSIISAWFEMNFISFTPVSGEKEPIEL